MSEGPKNPPPRRPASGQHPAVQAYRAKLESIAEHQMPELKELNAKIAKLGQSMPPPPVSEETIELLEVDIVLEEDLEPAPITEPDPNKDIDEEDT